jgi:hypothetical protein
MTHYSMLYEEISEAVAGTPPRFEDLLKLVRSAADDPSEPVSGFDSFEDFYAWFDTLTHYDQEDSDEPLQPHKLLLEVVYDSLLAEQ